MSILFFGFILFFCAFFIQLVVWRSRLPYRQTESLLKIYLLCLLSGILVFRSIKGIHFFGIFPPERLIDYLRLCLLYISATAAYIISYSAIEAQSPSVTIILKIAEAGKEGLTRLELEDAMSNENTVSPRLNDLVRDGYAVCSSNRYVLTGAGRGFIKIFIFYRKLLNRGFGG